MAKKTIGLCYFFDNKSNSGIVNYIFNIISALKTLEAGKRPKIIVFYSQNAPIEYLKSIEYQDIEFSLFKDYSSTYIIRKANSAIQRLFNIDLYKKIKYFNKIHCLYPYFEIIDTGFKDAPNKIHWLVDFNNRAFKEHYEDNGELVTLHQNKLLQSRQKVVLSSNALLEELKQYVPDYTCDIRILRFASTLPKLSPAVVDTAKTKYGLTTPYFMSPNQFWEHKNQIVVLKAIAKIKEGNPEQIFKVVFTGSVDVNRGKGKYIEQIRSFIQDNKLEEYIVLLGVIERNEQLALMKGSAGLIQPSLYEGWSTLVEEAKALNQLIILSDLPVHREQISENARFFNPANSGELAGILIDELKYPTTRVFNDYSLNIKSFGNEIINAFMY